MKDTIQALKNVNYRNKQIIASLVIAPVLFALMGIPVLALSAAAAAMIAEEYGTVLSLTVFSVVLIMYAFHGITVSILFVLRIDASSKGYDT